MGLFGRTSCREDRSWQVRLHLCDGDSVTVTEQLNEKEATEFYKDLKKELLESKSDWVEIKTDNGDDYHADTRLFNKINIKHIKLTTN